MSLTYGNIFVLITTFLSFLSTPINICVCIALFKGRRTEFKTPFYRIFNVLALMDTVALINYYIAEFLPNWGILTKFALSTGTIFGSTFFFIAWFCRISQGMSSTLVALNRLTAMAVPLKYEWIWSPDRMPYVLLIQLGVGFPIAITSLVSRTDYEVQWNVTGQMMNAYLVNDAIKAIVLNTGELFETIFVVIIVTCYIIILYKVMTKKKVAIAEAGAKATMRASAELSATIVTLCICCIELLYFTFTTVTVIIDIDMHVFFDLLAILTNIYCSINCLLLLFFSESLQIAVRKLICGPGNEKVIEASTSRITYAPSTRPSSTTIKIGSTTSR